MASYSFQQVLVWDVNPGGAIKALRNGTVTVKNATTDATLFVVESDQNGLVSFTTTDVTTVYLVSPGGLTSGHITAASAIEAAAGASVSEDVAVAALVADSGSGTRAALESDFGTKAQQDTNTSALATVQSSIGGLLDARFMSDIADPWDGMAQAAAVASERARIERLMTGTGTRVALGRRGDDYNLYQELSPGIWWRITLAYDPTTGGQHHSLYQSVIGLPMQTVDQTDASWVFTVPGAGWVTTSNATAYGGSYIRNDSTGATATWTTPSGVTKVGLRAFRTTNGGYSKVSIDGSATAANLLPTAQQEVDAGRLASTALVANGGTLNPTDRLYDCYVPTTAGLDELVQFADGLTAGVHTVQLVNTGYKETSSSSTRLYISGGIYQTASTTVAAGNDLAPLVTLLYNSSVYEYAVVFKPTGATSAPFIGNRHGNEIEDSLTFTVDGSAITPTDGSVTLGSEVVATRTSHLRHPDTGSTNVANGECVYTMTPTGGLEVHWTLDWLVSGGVGTAYAAMIPTQGDLCDMGAAAAGQVVTLLDNDNSEKSSTRSDTLAMWDSDGGAAVSATVRNLPDAVNRWAGVSTDFAWLQDRTGGDFNKGYFQRVQGAVGTETVSAGTVWESFIRYRAAWLDDTSILAS